MSNLDKKQKIVLGIVVAIIVGFICYYVYARDENKNTQIENNLEVEDTKEENEEEQYSDTFILVHVSGAVNKEGVVELKANSRISDAIDKARRIKRGC